MLNEHNNFTLILSKACRADLKHHKNTYIIITAHFRDGGVIHPRFSLS